jgi:uncharacterized protein (DUF305 family)
LKTPVIATFLLVGAAAASCRSAAPGAGNTPKEARPPIVQPGAPGEPSKVIETAQATDLSHVQATDADVKFMQGMIHHHNQALLMAAMIATHTKTPELIAMGKKIQLSQSGEIQAMKEWLTGRKQEVPMIMPDGTAMTGHGDMAPMPGMLTPQQMKALDTARGAKFDELFLTGMIQHHKGALKMVADLREAGGGKEPNIGDFLNAVDNDQRMEIVRMYGLLGRPVEWS